MNTPKQTGWLPRISIPVLVAALISVSGMAQEEGDRLMADDGDLLIYRSDDGSIKIKREGSDVGTWVAVVNPDDSGRKVVVKKMREMSVDDEGNVAVLKPDDDAGDNEVVIWKSDDGKEMRFRSPRVHRFRFEGDSGDRFEDYFLFRDHDFGPFVPGGSVGPDWMRGHPLEWVEESAENRRKIADMDRQSRELSRQIARAEGDGAKRLEAELDELLGEIFDLKQETRTTQIERLQERVDELLQTQSTRRTQREDIIARRKKQLLGERDPLEW